MKIIAKESPLRRLPVELDPTQASFLDAIRLTSELGGLAYSRLTYNLQVIGSREGEEWLGPGDAASVFLDAWSVVDALHRLREILLQMKGIKRRGPKWELFRRSTDGVANLRNTVQHLNNELADMAKNRWSPWGRLNWLQLVDLELLLVRAYFLCPGRIQSGTHPVPNPCNLSFYGMVDHVHLFSKNDEFDLSRAVRHAADVIQIIEDSLTRTFPASNWSGSDLLAVIEFQMNSDGPVSGPAPITREAG